jgi:hypothetical protein
MLSFCGRLACVSLRTPAAVVVTNSREGRRVCPRDQHSPQSGSHLHHLQRQYALDFIETIRIFKARLLLEAE